MSAKEQSKKVGRVAEGKAPSKPRETVPARRALLAGGVPMAAALVAAACGKSGFSGKNADNKTITDKPGPNDPVGFEPPPCSPLGNGKIVIHGDDPQASAQIKLYGGRLNAMIVVKVGGIADGDYLVLSRVVGEGQGEIIAKRLVNALDVGKPIVFDSLNLSGTNKIDLMVSSAGGRKRVALDTSDNAFTAAQSFTKDGTAYPVYDAFSLSSTNHPNYGAEMDKALINVGNPNGVKNFGLQLKNETRPFQVANANSMWAIPAGLRAADTVITDAFGDEIAGAKSATSNFLAQHSMFIVYLKDNTAPAHYHRYFFFVG